MGPIRVLLRDCENFADGSFADLLKSSWILPHPHPSSPLPVVERFEPLHQGSLPLGELSWLPTLPLHHSIIVNRPLCTCYICCWVQQIENFSKDITCSRYFLDFTFLLFSSSHSLQILCSDSEDGLGRCIGINLRNGQTVIHCNASE